MTRIADQITAALAREVESRTQWDEAPGLYFLYLEGGQPRLSQLKMPDALWAAAPPAVVLASVAESSGRFAQVLQAAALEGLHGAAFRTEMWMVSGERGATEANARLLADAYARNLHERPDRVEVRNMYAVDRAGIAYAATLRRRESAARTSVSYPGPGKAALSGDVLCALDGIVSALLGVGMSQRPGPEEMFRP